MRVSDQTEPQGRELRGPSPETDILGVRISALDMQSTLATIERWISQRSRHYVCICTVHTVMECQRDPTYLEIVNRAGLRTPDGMPLVWLSRWAGHSHVERVYGPDLLLEMAKRSAVTGHRHFFYGGAPAVADELASRLQSRFPGLQVAGTYSPPVMRAKEPEMETTIRTMNESGADIIWIGLGTPKQDWWAANHRPFLDAPVLIGVGAAFDFHTGRVRQAPARIQRSGLEWLFRLVQDPGRLWKRYLVYNSLFVLKVIRAKLRERRSRMRNDTPCDR